MNAERLAAAYTHVARVSYSPRRKMWLCPECQKLRWSCEDLGAGKNKHFGAANDRGQTTPPSCINHPGVPMVLDYP